MMKWVCANCGEEIPLTKLDEVNKERREKGITIEAHFVNCKGTGKHILGVAGRFFLLTPKGKRVLEAIDKFIQELQEIEVQHLEEQKT